MSQKKILAAVGVATLVAVSLWLGFFHNGSSKPTTNNFNTVSDMSTGITFNMSKAFEPIPRDELTAMNPSFSYGFRAVNDPQAICIISQVRLSGGGSISTQQLRDGILTEVKKIHSDAQVANGANALRSIKFGEASGILLEIVFTDGDKKIKRVEAVALGKVNEVIAYCQSLYQDNARYYNDFTIFFASLKLT